LRLIANEILSTATVDPYVFESSETYKTFAAVWEVMGQIQDSAAVSEAHIVKEAEHLLLPVLRQGRSREHTPPLSERS
jgi:hypothetical protein